MNESKQLQFVEQYKGQQLAYSKYADCIKNILVHAIPDNCKVHSIECRSKSLESFQRKCLKVNEERNAYKYSAPLEEITDLAGVRVIAFFPKSLPPICQAIEENFIIKWVKDIGEERYDQGRIGYRSIHYLIQLPETRVAFAEYKDFKGLIAEIQVRTILQHAWAEMEHDIQYKSSEQIPREIQKRFAALAGMIEIADREFQSVQDEDNKLRNSVKASLEDELARPRLKTENNNTPDNISKINQKRGSLENKNIHLSTQNVRDIMMSGDYSRAVSYYSKLISSEPDSYTLLIGRAKASFLAGNRSQALEDLDKADKLKPNDNSIQSIRSKIEDGVVILPSNLQEAWQLTSKANELLAAGNGEEAFAMYSKSQSIGFSAIYSTYNKAMACTLVKDYNGASYFLGQVTPIQNSPMEVNIIALNAIISAISGHGFKQNYKLLNEKLEILKGFQKNQSPLRHLESGFIKRDTKVSNEIQSVFALLAK